MSDAPDPEQKPEIDGPSRQLAAMFVDDLVAALRAKGWEIVTAELFPRLVDKARENWALENNIFNLGCRAYVGKAGGERENYLTWVRDLAEGKYLLPWDKNIRIRDGWKYYPDGVKLGPMPKQLAAE